MLSPSPHNDAQRLRILQAMGIVTYVPRQPLPGAAPSPALLWKREEETVARAPGVTASVEQTPEQAISQRATSPSHEVPAPHGGPQPITQETREAASAPVREAAERSRLRDSFGDDQAVPAPQGREEIALPPATRAAVQAPAQAAQDSAAGTEARFQALLYAVGDGLGVLIAMPALARQQLPERERALLQAILRWLGLSEAAMRDPRVFQWPLPGFPGGTLAVAGASLRVFLDQAQRELSFSRTVVFGELLGEALELGGQAREVYLTYGLQELLAVPALKRECWLTLAPLQRAMAPPRD